LRGVRMQFECVKLKSGNVTKSVQLRGSRGRGLEREAAGGSGSILGG
jgi:hypothetical protein